MSKFSKVGEREKAPPKLYFYKYSKDEELCVASAIDEYLKRGGKWR